MKNSFKKLQTDFWEIVQYDTQGKRSAMEDYSDFMVPFTSSETSLLLSVFDGHAGHRCASFLANSLPSELKKETTALQSPGGSSLLPSEAVFKKIFKSLDQMWLEAAAKKETRIEDGSTALCVALDCSDLIIANCGDCRAILAQAGQTVVLTRDHKPTDEVELQRIIHQGGTVIGGRLQGKLAVSRAFGNYEFKESQILSSEPEIHHVTLMSDVEYLIIGSDGLYEHFTNEEIISYIKTGILSNSLETVVKNLIDEAIDRGTEDNITILVVKFEKAFKKLLKKKSKKQQQGKATNGFMKNNSGKTNGKHSVPDSPPSEPSKIGLWKKGLKTVKNSSSPATVPAASPTDHHATPLTKKKTEPKKLKPSEKPFKLTAPEDDKWNRFKPFKHDFFGTRTPVTISG